MPRLDFAYAGIKFKSSYFNMVLKGDYKNMINNERLSGILLHPTSLPSPYGIGDLGDEAYAFIDFLARAGQHLWQVLPLTHTGFGDSPYQSFSAFAGQPLLIDPRHLIRLGLIGGWELTDCPIADPSHVDYGQVIPWKEKVLALAYSRFPQKRHEIPGMDQSFQEFCESNRYWLDDYALFMACKKLHHGADWLHWPDEYRCPTLEFKAGLFKSMHEDIEYYRFIQFLFFDEWKRIKKYANDHGIRIIGDIPIFVSMDSADVWANQHLFQLDSKGYPTRVAGVPPDYFSASGQLWGNPLYNWEAHEAEHFSWWISRIRAQLYNLDILRVDHFRGFEAFWSIPYGEPTAVNGEWVKAPGHALVTQGDEGIIAQFFQSQVLACQCGERLAAHQHLTALNGDGSADDIEQGGLAAAVAADDGDKLTVLDGKIKVFKQTHFGDRAGVIGFRDIFKLKHFASPCLSCRRAPE